MPYEGFQGAGIAPTPAPAQYALEQNFLDLRTSGWAQQYLPELVEQEAEVLVIEQLLVS